MGLCLEVDRRSQLTVNVMDAQIYLEGPAGSQVMALTPAAFA